ncbi:hypothetical protein [Spirosoma validum]|uniref:Uncharacterized protein n=1 Tax=Spirosoma validum TaxID=2771355 RepID=A0A927B397_9BACT|nr:hypothetical protein [Spirosoma validum]MBD2754533.1 hypothetical protein [Spirosoma validum]
MAKATMWETFIDLIIRYPLDFISQLFALLPITIGLFRFNHLTVSMKWVVLFFLAYFLKDSIAWIHSLQRESNLYLYNLLSFPEIAIVAVIYAFSMPRQSKKIIGFTLGCLLLNFFFYSSQAISAGNLTIARLFIIIIILVYLNHVLNESLVRNILRHDLFWFSAGLLIYAAGTFFIFLFGKELFNFNASKAYETFDFYWNFQEIIFIICCILSTVGIKFSESNNRSNFATEL